MIKYIVLGVLAFYAGCILYFLALLLQLSYILEIMLYGI